MDLISFTTENEVYCALISFNISLSNLSKDNKYELLQSDNIRIYY